MAPARLSPLFAAALALAPGLASAGVPVGIYPFRVPGLSTDQRADLHAMVAAGLSAASRRGVLALRSPAFLPGSCGESPEPACLAGIAGGGLVFAGRGELKSGLVVLSAAFTDRNGARSREVRVVVDLVVQNLRPVSEALLALEVDVAPDGAIVRDDPPAARDPAGAPGNTIAGAPLPAPTPARAAAGASAPRTPPPAASAAGETRDPARIAAATAAPTPTAERPGMPPASDRILAPSAPTGSLTPVRPADGTRERGPSPGAPALWRRTAGPWLTAIGVALLGGGAAVGYLNRGDADDLEARYARGELAAADRASYDRVQRYNVLSSALFAAGATATAWGACLWIAAPPAPGAGVAVGAGGRF
jgi:hypothetical protein